MPTPPPTPPYDTDQTGTTGPDGFAGTPGRDRYVGLDGNDNLRGANGDDVLIGDGGDDFLQGQEGNDYLDGGDGIDNLRGGNGDDTILGGAGDDLLRGGNGIDILDGGDGNDRISFFELDQTQGVVADLAAQTMSNDGYGNSETLISIEGLGADTRFVDTFLGSDGVNLLFGRSDDIIDGRGGDDSLISGASVNGGGTINGGDGIDTLQLTGDFLVDSNGDGIAEIVTTSIGVTVNLSAPTNQLQNDGNGRQATLLNIENLAGTQFNDLLIGNAANNVIDGFGGNDILFGINGNNTLRGGAGSDTILDWFPSNDIIDGGEELDETTTGIDAISYYNPNSPVGQLGVTVDLRILTAQDTGRGMDTISNIEVLFGTRFADTLNGDDSGNALAGMGGVDSIFGHGGDDIIVVQGFGSVADGGAGADDVISFWSNQVNNGQIIEIGAGVTIDLNLSGVQVGPNGNLTADNFENISGSRFDDNFTGNALGNSIGGSHGDDIINGGAGDDALYGDGTLFFDAAGEATFLDEIPAAGTGPAPGLAAGNDTLTGGEGDDELYGGGGDDILSGGIGSDFAFGGDGDDVYNYNILTDGADSVDLGDGEDRVTISGGGEVRITLSFSAAANGNPLDPVFTFPFDGGLAVRVQAEDGAGNLVGDIGRFDDEGVVFVADEDGTFFDIRILENNSQIGFYNALGLGTPGDDNLDASDFLGNVAGLGGAGNDTITGGFGNDYIQGGAGIDVLSGNDGNDLLVDGGGGGSKTYLGGNGQDRAFVNILANNTNTIDLGASVVGGIDIVNIQGPTNVGQIRLTLDVAAAGNGNALDGNGNLAVTFQREDGNDGLAGALSRGDDEHILYNSPNGSAGFDIRDAVTGQQYGIYSFAYLGGDFADIDTALSPTRSYFYSLGGGDDVVTGGNLGDYLDGGIGSDTLAGALGDDILAGGAGNDNLDGGDGTDVAVFGKASSAYSVVVNGAGYDVVDVATQERDFVTNVETLRFTDGDFATASIAVTAFAKPSASYAVVFLNGGYTVIDRETLVESNLGNVSTIAFADGSFNAADIDLNVIIAPPGTTNDARFGSSNGDYIVGNDGYNLLQGQGGDDFVVAGGNGGAEPSVDQIRGNDGNDTLVGGSGSDLFRGGAGVDRFFGQGGNDRISFFEVTATQGVIADLETGIISNDGFGNVETFSGIEGLGGSTRFADVFRGDSGNNLILADTADTVEGRGGDDRFQLSGSVVGGGIINGGDGFDFMYAITADRQEDTNGDGISDSVAGTRGVVVDLALGQVLNDGFGNTATLISIEGIGGGNLSDTLLGDGGDNRIALSNGNDIIDGRGGTDTLDVTGSLSTDFVFTRTGATTYTVTDTTGVNASLDNVEFAQFNDGTFALSALAVGPGPGNDYVEGTEGPDTLDGLGGDDTIRGLGGDDNLFGSAGNDNVDGGAGTDVVEGGDGDDTLSGGQGNDIVRGGNGNDAITDAVGGGSNQLFGDAGDDVFTLNGGFNFINGGTGNDVVTNSGTGTDVITHDMATGGSDSYNTGGGIDFVTLTTVAGSETRITFTSSEVGNGSATDSNSMANQDGGLAVRIQIEGNSGGLFGPVSRGDDEGVYYTASAGSTVEVRDLVSDASRGSFRTAFLGTSGNDVLAAPTGDFANASLYANAGMGDDTVNGSTVDDFLVGGAGNDALSGNSGNDQFLGGGGNDAINGGDGNDIATGGLGDDSIIGGAGDDTAIINVATDGADSIDLGEGGDVVQVSGAGQVRLTFTSGEVGNGNVNDAGTLANQDGGLAVRMQAEDGSDALTGPVTRTDDEGITFVAAAGTTFDVRDLPTGTARGNGFQVVTLGTSATETLTAVNPALSYYINGGAGRDTISGGNVVDFLVGGADNDIIDGGQGDDGLLGGAGVDRLIGGSGNDRLDGGAETDILEGGTGNDTYVTDGIDVITEAEGEGIDEVISSADASLGANLEDLTLVGAAINGNGNELNNLITGNANNNLLRGSDGNDLLLGALGNDTLQGGNGNDVLDGGDGDDSLDGGAAGDIMTGGAGNDLYQVDNVADRVVEAVGGGTNDRVVSTVSYTLVGEVEVLNLVGPAAVNGTGSESNNSINGNDLANVLAGVDGNDILSGFNGNDSLFGGNGVDVLRGGEGDDSLDGGTGADSLSGGNGNDLYYIDNSADVVAEAAGGGTNDRALVSANWTVAREVEIATQVGTADLALTGNLLDNTLNGNVGNNVIRGAEGNDTVLGNDGNDTLFGDAGVDILRGGNGDDILVGGAGADQLQGGVGADTFRFLSTADLGLTGATSDRVLDFSSVQGDRIDLSTIDANSGVAGNQAFSFIGGAAFTGVAGQLRVQASGTNQLVYGDVNGDGVADFLIVVTPVGAVPLAGGDFQL